jgi:hypothetical protein
VGAVLTDRRIDGGGSGILYGTDGTVRLTRNLQFDFQLLGSYTEETGTPSDGSGNGATFDRGKHTVAADGETFDGHAYFAGLMYNSRHFSAYQSWLGCSPAFRAANGFLTRNDYRRVLTGFSVAFYPAREWLSEWYGNIEHYRSWNFNESIGDLKREYIEASLELGLKWQTSASLSLTSERERYLGHLYEGIYGGQIVIDSRPSRWLRFNLHVGRGRQIARFEEVLGMTTDVGLYVDIQPTSRLRVIPDYVYSRMDHLDGHLAANPGTDRKIYSGSIIRTGLYYQFTREWFVRAIVEYDQFDDRVSIEPLLTYRINPFTVFYAGSTMNYRHWDLGDHETLREPKWQQASRTFFAKFQYLVRL